MSKRVSQTILLCEDELHERITKSYLKVCGLPHHPPAVKSLVASKRQYGGNDNWVLNEFPRQLHACRQRQARAETLLIVVIDADNHTIQERRRHLLERLKSAGYEEFGVSEPAILLIPKRHIETWLRALVGESVTEEEDCKGWKKVDREEVRQAASTLFDWARPNAILGPTCVPSLIAAQPDWNKIG